MPWFLTSITWPLNAKMADKRTFGFYNTYIEAHDAVTTNKGDMAEHLYDFLVIEYIEPGIHPSVLISEWWKWNVQLDRWDKVDGVPKMYIGMTNWALG